jgi:8-oxo-dGTP pyrophosphatase MutT (NUDIX family)
MNDTKPFVENVCKYKRMSVVRVLDWLSLNPQNSPFLKNAVIVAINEDNDQVLVVQEASTRQFGFPGGRVEPSDPTIFEAAQREFEEETGSPFFPIWSIVGGHMGIACYVWNSKTAFFVFRVKPSNIFDAGPPPPGNDGEIIYKTSENPMSLFNRAYPFRTDALEATYEVFVAAGLLR